MQLLRWAWGDPDETNSDTQVVLGAKSRPGLAGVDSGLLGDIEVVDEGGGGVDLVGSEMICDR